MNNIQQLALFPLETVEHTSYRHVSDPYWDQITAPQHISTNERVGEQTEDTTIAPQDLFISQSVGEQLEDTTIAPQHPPKHTHWVEKYWVERGSKKHYYWRYMWMEGRKMRRCYLGRYGDKVVAVEQAIAEGMSPMEIKHLITNTHNQ
jgi:hypothetical protein